MLFNPERYKNLIQEEENKIFTKILIIIVISIIIAFALNIILKFDILIVLLICLIVGLIISVTTYSSNQTKIEEMKWKLDIYEKLMK